MLSITCALVLALQGGNFDPGGDQTEKQIEIVCRSQAMVRGTRILVGDLVDILPPGEQAHRIAQIPFGPRPASGFSRIVTRHEVLQKVVMAGENASLLHVTGAREIVVQPAYTEIAVQEVRDAADLALRVAISAEQGADVEFDLVTRVRQFKVPPGRDGVDFKARVRPGQVGMTTALVDLTILVDDEAYKVIPLQYKLNRYHQILQVDRTIQKGQPLSQSNLIQVRELLGQSSGLYLQSFADVQGKVARRDLQANRTLNLGDIADPAVVFRGQLVIAVATRGPIKVTIQGIANADGAKGDVITVTNPSSGQVLSAVVNGPGVVVVPNRR
jgi:flagella basal body P-ring formation protein FlgA